MSFQLADCLGKLIPLNFRNEMHMACAHRNGTQVKAEAQRFLNDRPQSDLAGVRIQPNRVAVHDPCCVVAESGMLSSRGRVFIFTR